MIMTAAVSCLTFPSSLVRYSMASCESATSTPFTVIHGDLLFELMGSSKSGTYLFRGRV